MTLPRNPLQRFYGRRDLHFVTFIGYVGVPEHVHLVISEPPQGSPSKVLQVLKQKISQALRATNISPCKRLYKRSILFLKPTEKRTKGSSLRTSKSAAIGVRVPNRLSRLLHPLLRVVLRFGTVKPRLGSLMRTGKPQQVRPCSRPTCPTAPLIGRFPFTSYFAAAICSMTRAWEPPRS